MDHSYYEYCYSEYRHCDGHCDYHYYNLVRVERQSTTAPLLEDTNNSVPILFVRLDANTNILPYDNHPQIDTMSFYIWQSVVPIRVDHEDVVVDIHDRKRYKFLPNRVNKLHFLLP
jgi:hypothetical protein